MPTTRERIYLGIDPGTTIIGYGVIREDARGHLTPVAWGVLRNPGTDDGADKRATRDGLTALIKEHRPMHAAVERLFFLNNKRSAMPVSEMRGVIMLALADAGVQTTEFTPLQVKQRVCGHGQATKAQMQKMVRLLLAIKEEVRPDDAADALALALCAATA